MTASAGIGIRLCAAAALLGGAAFPAYAQRPAHWRVYRAVDGLARSWCTAVTVSPQGRVWVRHGDQDPVSWLDGFDIRQIPAPPNSNFPILESADSRIWSIDDFGLIEFRKDRWIRHESAGIQLEIQTNLSRRIHPLPLLTARDRSVLYLLSDRLVQFDSLSGRERDLVRAADTGLERFLDMADAGDGSVWISGESGLGLTSIPSLDASSGGGWREYLPPARSNLVHFQYPALDDRGGVTCVAESRGSGRRLLARWSGQEWEAWPMLQGKVRQGWYDPVHGCWAFSFNSLVRVDRAGAEHPVTEGLPAAQYYDMAREPKGVFWLATSEGLARFMPLPWREFPDQPGAGTPILAGQMDGEGQLWWLSSTNLILWQGGAGTALPLPAGSDVESESPETIELLADGRLLLGWADRILAWDPLQGIAEPVHHPEGLRLRLLGSLGPGEQAVQVLPAGQAGELRLERYTLQGFQPLLRTPADPRFVDRLEFCRRTASGDLWVGGAAGIAVLRDRQLQVFGRADGAAPDQAFCFLEIDASRYWCGGRDGIHEFDGKTWTRIRSGLDQVHAMIRARDRSIWAASRDGIHHFVDGVWLDNDAHEGLSSAVAYCVLEDRHGGIWVGTGRGLVRHEPGADIDPPRVSISSANGTREFLLDEPVRFELRGQDKWKITSPERLLYSWRLDNLQWTPFAAVSSVDIRELTPGRHYFQARAMDRNGNVDRQHYAVFDFTVALPWYLETRLLAVLAGAVLVAVGLAWLAVNRHLRLKRSYAQVEGIVAQRTQELQAANQALWHSQKMQALGTLAAGIAHDFNNILSIIKGSAQLIETQIADPEKIQVRTRRILTVVDQAAVVVRALLGFSRAPHAGLVSEDLNSIVQETLRLFGDRLLPNVTFRCDLAPALPPVPCARDLMQQLLLNLILNASDALGGAGEVSVVSRLAEALPANPVLAPNLASRYVLLEVRDRGVGISPENLPRLFEPFFTTKSFSSKRGTGLGLSMVYEFAKAQGCGLHVESELLRGSTFTVIVPVPDASLNPTAPRE